MTRVWKYLKARLEPMLLSDTEFVDLAFRDVLGRDADQGGLEFYRGKKDSVKRRADVVRRITSAPSIVQVQPRRV
jgi:Domain of unknown function (DUF4214)